jgi:hypothetical protein
MPVVVRRARTGHGHSAHDRHGRRRWFGGQQATRSIERARGGQGEDAGQWYEVAKLTEPRRDAKGGGGGPAWWCFEVAVNSSGQRWLVTSLEARGGI